MTSPAAARGQEVRRRLLGAAIELIPELGWSAVSTRVLADRAGVTPSAVHYHYPSLTALLNEAAAGCLREVLDGAWSALDGARTADDVFDAVLGSVDRYTGDDPVSLLAIEACLAATRDPELRDLIREVFAEYRRGLARLLGERGVPAPEATASVLTAAVDGLLLHRGIGAGGDAADRAAVASVLRRLAGNGEAR
ncbi:TetR/AcrR family transcriptional regulator [Actinomadura sediminis]|uniref:TetR/AcrR family transcriptional regulator n=1 Tax=Actinomadura sediminis TaxID=1038904 RepID=A0ABW3EUS6_9ACTN